MPAATIAGERIRALAGGTVPGIAVVVAGRRGCGLPGRPGWLTSLPTGRRRWAWCARGFR